MSVSKSRWREQSREVIDRVLADIPSDAPPGQVRRLLWAAYPFGPRENHPYRMYLVEVREAMKRRGQRGADGKPAVVLLLRNKDGLPWLDVDCGWCKGEVPGGCMMCVAKAKQVREVVKDPLWLALRQAAKGGDQVAWSALRDLVQERVGV